MTCSVRLASKITLVKGKHGRIKAQTGSASLSLESNATYWSQKCTALKKMKVHK